MLFRPLDGVEPGLYRLHATLNDLFGQKQITGTLRSTLRSESIYEAKPITIYAHPRAKGVAPLRKHTYWAKRQSFYFVRASTLSLSKKIRFRFRASRKSLSLSLRSRCHTFFENRSTPDCRAWDSASQRAHDLRPDARSAPANEAIVTSGARTVVIRQVTPRRI